MRGNDPPGHTYQTPPPPGPTAHSAGAQRCPLSSIHHPNGTRHAYSGCAKRNHSELPLLRPPPPRVAPGGKGPQRRPQRRLGRRLEEVAKAVGGGYCRLQIPSKPAPGIRGTVAGLRRGALEGGAGVPPLPPFQRIPAPPALYPNRGQDLVQGAQVRKHRVTVLGQARVTARQIPWNTCCRHKQTPPLHDYKTVSNTPAYTPEHNST